MIQALKQQYALTQGTREITFNFIETKVGNHLITPLPTYVNKTLASLLVHTASCYFHWMWGFAMQQPVEQLNDEDFTTIDQVRQLFKKVDDAMNMFLSTYNQQLEIPIKGIIDMKWEESATPLQLFIHVLTHEFHHKGQIVMMCRMLGYPPPDTDVSNFFSHRLLK